MWFCPQCADRRSDAESVCPRCGALAVANPFADRDEPAKWLSPGLEPSELEIPGKASAKELLAQTGDDPYLPYRSPRLVDDESADPDFVDSEAARLERQSRMAEAAEEVKQFSFRMSLREVFGLMTFLAIVFSFLLNFGEYGVGIVLLILFVNLCGIVIGLAITHLGGLPNDGG